MKVTPTIHLCLEKFVIIQNYLLYILYAIIGCQNVVSWSIIMVIDYCRLFDPKCGVTV